VNFYLALKAMQMGKKVSRSSSENVAELGYLCIETYMDRREFVGHFKDKGGSERFALRMSMSLEDIEATDWEIVEDL
jgi:hypothetical protein